MDKQKTIAALNKLLEINNDRIDGYETASANTEEQELHKLFSEFRETSQKCRHELITEISKLGGKASEGTKVSGKFFRVWMDVKSALTGEDRKAILNSCEYGEQQAEETYQKVLKEESGYLSPQHQTMIQTQLSLLKSDQNKIRLLINALIEAS